MNAESAGAGDAVLACYAELAETLGRMTVLARGREWQSLPALDARCSGIFEKLWALHEQGIASPDPIRVADLARRVRTDQVELQRLLAPQFRHMARRIGQARQPS